jgi:hypothetical protein
MFKILHLTTGVMLKEDFISKRKAYLNLYKNNKTLYYSPEYDIIMSVFIDKDTIYNESGYVKLIPTRIEQFYIIEVPNV